MAFPVLKSEHDRSRNLQIIAQMQLYSTIILHRYVKLMLLKKLIKLKRIYINKCR